MTAVLAWTSSSPIDAGALIEEVKDYLLVEAPLVSSWSSTSRQRGIVRFDWTPAPKAQSALVLGFPECGSDTAAKADKATLLQTDGGFSVFHAEQSLLAFRSWTGDRTVYWRETPRGLFVSNRISLLSALGPIALDAQGVSDLCGFGYCVGKETLFKGIFRLSPGEALVVTMPGTGAVETPRLDWFCAPLTTAQVLEETREWVVKQISALRGFSEPFVLPLSGGKDSRALAGMLHKAGILQNAQAVYTRGTPYSPDMLAAQDLVGVLGVRNHQTNVPPHLPGLANYPSMILNAVAATEGCCSLFDRFAMGPRVAIWFDGHENNTKSTYFRGADRGDVHQRIMETVPANPCRLLTPEAERRADQRMRGILAALEERGVPNDKLPQGYMWLVRTAGWVGTAAESANFMSRSINLLLARELLRIGMGASPQDREAEVIAFALIASANPELLKVPFANDVWPESLPDTLERAGWRGPSGIAARPYRVHSSFPSGANPFLSNATMDLSNALRPLMIAHAARLEGVNYAAGSTGNGTKWHIRHLGLAMCALFGEFGVDLFRRSSRAGILEQFASLFSSPPERGDVIQKYEELLCVHEKSIAALVREVARGAGT